MTPEYSSANLSHRWPGRLAALLAYIEYSSCGSFIAERNENPVQPDLFQENASGAALVGRLDEAERLVEAYGAAVAAREQKAGTARAVLDARTDLRIFFARNLK